MKVRLLSDLHQEVSPWHPDPVECDVVILAGDIHYADRAIGWAREAFPDVRVPVLAVAGNHEGYQTGTVRENIDRMRKDAAGTENVRFLENESVVIGGVRFLGATLWTDFQIGGDQQRGLMLARQYMNDFHLCRWIDNGTERLFEPEDSLAMHKESVRWLHTELAKPFAGRTVVITHHLPTPKSIHKRFHGDPLNCAFASNLEHLMDGISVWAHGHTHAAVRAKVGWRTRVGECHVLANPRGYSDFPECGDAPFHPDFVFDITDSGVEVPELRTAATKPAMTRQQLLDAVPVRKSDNTTYIRLADIPEPWRTEFKRANDGGTCPIIAEAPEPMGCAYPWDWLDYVNSGRHGIRASGLKDDEGGSR